MVDQSTYPRRRQVRTVIVFAAWLLTAAATAQQVPSNYRAYPLRHAKAAETAARLRPALVQADPTAQVVVDPETNQLLVNGSNEIQALAAKLLTTIDQPAAEPSPTRNNRSTEVKGYRVADPRSVASELQAQFPAETGARIVVDERLQQVIVVAPADVQRAVASRLNTEKLPAANPMNAQPLGQELGTGTTYRLQNIQSREFEAELRRLWGNRINVAASQNGEEASVVAPGPQGPQKVMQIDRLNDRITFLGTGRTVATWRSFVAALDAPRNRADDITQLISLQNADPQKIQTAVELIGATSQQKEGDVTATVPLGRGGARPRSGNDLVSMIFQQAGEQAQPNQPAAKPGEPPAAAPNQPAAPGEEVADDTGGSLIGPVQIEFIEGLDVIVIRGHKRDVARVQKIIEEIDRLSRETQPIIDVHPLLYVNSEAMTTLVSEIYTEILSPRQGTVSIKALVEPNAVLMIGRAESVSVVKELIEKLDQPILPTSRFEVFRLKHISAVDAEQTVRNFFVTRPGIETNVRTGLGTRVQVIADFRSNTLIVQASPRDLEEVRRLIQTIDVEVSESSTQLRVFYLKNAIATDLATVLQSAISGQAAAATGQQGQQPQQGGGQQQGGTTSSSQARQPSQALEMIGIDQNGGRLIKSGILSDVVVTANASTNALVVRAPAKSMELVAALIEQLDRLPDASAQIKVFTIDNGDATSLSTMLQQLFGQTTTTGQAGALGGLGGLGQALQTGTAGGETSIVPIRIAVDSRTNSIIVSGAAADLEVVETILTRLDENIHKRKVSVVRLRNTSAAAVQLALQTYLTNQQNLIQTRLLNGQLVSPFGVIDREIFVVNEDVTNSLIVSATPQYHDEIIRVIHELDVRPPMVMIQVLIAELTLNNTFEFGTEFGLQDSLVFDRGKALGAVAETPSTPGFNFNTALPYPNVRSYQQETFAGQSLSNLGIGRTNPTLGYGGLVLSAASESVSMLLRALENDNRLQILSRPEIMTMHNQPAYVHVGQTVSRVQTSTITNIGAIQNGVGDYDIGIILSVLPLINDDGVIVLGVEAQRSSLGPEASGTTVAVSATGEPVRTPPINLTLASTTISARDGQTCVFAGLITKSHTMEIRRIPYLSDVPVLGKLFEYKNDNEIRTELLIVMTPHIIRDDADVEMMKLQESSRMSWCLSDVTDVVGDWGLQGGSCAFCTKQAPLIFPDVCPTGMEYMHGEEVVPVPPQQIDEPDLGATNLPSTNEMRLQAVPASAQRATVKPLSAPRTDNAKLNRRIPSTNKALTESAGSPNSVSPATYQGSGPTRLPAVNQ